MSFRRRDILKAGAVFSAAAAIPSPIWAENAFAPQPGAWRSFQITTKLEIVNPVGETQAWVPLPSVNQKEWFRSNSSEWKTNGSATRVRDPKYGAEILHVVGRRRKGAHRRDNEQDYCSRPCHRS